MRNHLGHSLAVAVTGVALAAGAFSAPAAATQARPTLHVVLSSAGAKIPSHLQPGRVRITIGGDRDGFFEIFRARHRAGPARLVRDLKAFDRDGIPTALDKDFILLGGGAPRTSVSLTLTKGTYYAMNVGVNKTSAVTTLNVAGATSNAIEPTVTGTVTAIGDRAWAANKLDLAHTGWLRLANHSTRTHFLLALQLRRGVTIGQVQKFFRGEGDIDGNYFTSVVGASTVVSAGRTEDIRYSLPRGRYALVSYWSGAHGTLDASAGMVRGMTLH